MMKTETMEVKLDGNSNCFNTISSCGRYNYPQHGKR